MMVATVKSNEMARRTKTQSKKITINIMRPYRNKAEKKRRNSAHYCATEVSVEMNKKKMRLGGKNVNYTAANRVTAKF